MTKDIISTMIGQHRTLQEELGSVSDEVAKGAPDSKLILTRLNKFSKDLIEHLALENNTFYVELLKLMSDKGMDTKDTESFIQMMKVIEKDVEVFLEAYNTHKSIEDNIHGFSSDLSDIAKTLNLRIESEEEGVYMYWSKVKT